MTLDEAIREFKLRFAHLQEKAEAHSMCSTISDTFIRFLVEKNIPGAGRARRVEYVYNNARHYPLKVKWVNRDAVCRTRGGCYYHVVVKMGRLRIDWTARQFHPRCRFPLIWKTRS